MTMYLPNPEQQPVGDEAAEFLDVPPLAETEAPSDVPPLAETEAPVPGREGGGPRQPGEGLDPTGER
jgi:hypothetical protein